jgi:hypothetical protein
MYQPAGTNPNTIHIPDEWVFNLDQMLLREEPASVEKPPILHQIAKSLKASLVDLQAKKQLESNSSWGG